MASSFQMLSPYLFAYDNPIKMIDVNGMSGGGPQTEEMYATTPSSIGSGQAIQIDYSLLNGTSGGTAVSFFNPTWNWSIGNSSVVDAYIEQNTYYSTQLLAIEYINPPHPDQKELEQLTQFFVNPPAKPTSTTTDPFADPFRLPMLSSGSSASNSPTASTATSPITFEAMVAQTRATEKKEEHFITLFRGVGESNYNVYSEKQWEDARIGIARPVGDMVGKDKVLNGATYTESQIEHCRGNSYSCFTSWTTKVEIAQWFAKGPSQDQCNYVILIYKFNASDPNLKKAPGYYWTEDGEYTYKGTVTGATPLNDVELKKLGFIK